MSDSRILPGARARLVDSNGVTTREFYDFFRRLQDANQADSAIREISERLGSPTGAPSDIPAPAPSIPASAQVFGGTGIVSSGSLSGGMVELDLDTLADSGQGGPLAFSRDAYGRVSGTRPLEPGDLPGPFDVYLSDGAGSFLTAPDGSLIAAPPNLVVVQGADDLPAPVSGVITLASNTAYLVAGTVDLSGARLVAGRNTAIRGTSSETAFLKSTGLSGVALISSAWTLPMQDLTITADVAISLDASANPNQSLDWSAVNFLNCGTVGTVKSFSNFIVSNSAFIDSGEVLLDGTIGTAAFTQCIFSGLAAKNIVRIPSTLTITRRFRVIYSSISVPSTGTGLNVSASASIPVESYILDTVNFSGAGTYLSGVTDTSNTALFSNCKGINNTAAGGQLYMQNNATATTITNTTDFFKVAGTTTPGGANMKFSHSNNRLTCNAAVQRKYLITVNLSFAANLNNVCEFGIYNSNISAVETASTIKATANLASGPTGRRESASTQFVTFLDQNDFIEVWVRNTTAAVNVTVEELNVAITEI